MASYNVLADIIGDLWQLHDCSLLLDDLHYLCRTSDRRYPVPYQAKGDTEPPVIRPFVPNPLVKFDVDWPEYSPIEYTTKKVLSKPTWADPEEPDGIAFNQIDGKFDRRSHTGIYKIDPKNKRPLNPVGRTGITGRGRLGKWGPNHAADAIVTRWKRDDETGIICRHPDSGKQILEFIAINRKDSNQWAIPGGMRDVGELATTTLKREFLEEATNSLKHTDKEQEAYAYQLDNFFMNGIPINKGYVDDPRNTDNAWMETEAFNFHDEESTIIGNIILKAGDDAVGVQWLEVSDDLSLYASHKEYIKQTAYYHDAHWIR